MNHSESGFRRKIWNYLRTLYSRLAVPPPKRLDEIGLEEHYSRYLGCSRSAFAEYISSSLTEGMMLEDYKDTWFLRRVKPLNACVDILEYLHFLNHQPSWKQQYARSLSTQNDVLVRKIDALIGKLIDGRLVIRAQYRKINAVQLENLVFYMLSEKPTRRNREACRYCMEKLGIPVANHGNRFIYKNCTFSGGY